MDIKKSLSKDKFLKLIKKAFFKLLFTKHEIALLISLIIIITVFSLMLENFFTLSNWITLLNQSSLTFIVATGLTIVVILGCIDLSVGSTVGLAGVIVAGFLNRGYGIPVSILLGLLVGLAVGLFNGLIVSRIGIDSFIVTLGSMSIAHGFIFGYTKGYPIYENIPKSFLFLGRGRLFGVTFPIFLAILIFILAQALLSWFKFGVHIYATGGNMESTRLAGIKVDNVRLVGFIIGGVLAAFTGVIMASRLGSGQPNAGDNFLFESIGAVVLGGTSLQGGKGSIYGTLIGVLVIGVIFNGLTMLNVSFYYQEVIKGLIIVAAVTYNYLSIRHIKLAKFS
jgi:ribose transport system permease protein